MTKQDLELTITDTKEILESLNGDLKITNDAIRQYMAELIKLQHELYIMEHGND